MFNRHPDTGQLIISEDPRLLLCEAEGCNDPALFIVKCRATFTEALCEYHALRAALGVPMRVSTTRHYADETDHERRYRAKIGYEQVGYVQVNHEDQLDESLSPPRHGPMDDG